MSTQQSRNGQYPNVSQCRWYVPVEQEARRCLEGSLKWREPGAEPTKIGERPVEDEGVRRATHQTASQPADMARGSWRVKRWRRPQTFRSLTTLTQSVPERSDPVASPRETRRLKRKPDEKAARRGRGTPREKKTGAITIGMIGDKKNNNSRMNKNS